MTCELSVVMCTYNEVERLPRALDEFIGTLKDHTEKVEILIIDNGSTDGTREFLTTIKHPCVRVILNEHNLGKGGSIKKGFRLSSGQFVCIHDPDCEYDGADVWRLYQHAQANSSKLVLGSRVKGGQARFHYFLNYLGVLGLSQLIRLLYGAKVSDAATAMKLLQGDYARSLQLECSGFELDFEIVVRVARLGGRIDEVPVEYHPRTVAQGKKIRPVQDGLRSLGTILRNRLLSAKRFWQPPVLAPPGPAAVVPPLGLPEEKVVQPEV